MNTIKLMYKPLIRPALITLHFVVRFSFLSLKDCVLVLEMASQTPMAVQNENLHIYAGKGIEAPKANVPKSKHRARNNRKALADISKTRKPSIITASKVPLKEKPAIRESGNLKNLSKNSDLTEEQIRKCHEWADEGIEHVHFSGNDLLTLQQDIAKQSVDQEIESVMSAMKSWNDMAYGLERPLQNVGKETEEFMELELEPEILLSYTSSSFLSDTGETEDLFLEDINDLIPFRDYSTEFTLKEEEDESV